MDAFITRMGHICPWEEGRIFSKISQSGNRLDSTIPANISVIGIVKLVCRDLATVIYTWRFVLSIIEFKLKMVRVGMRIVFDTERPQISGPT